MRYEEPSLKLVIPLSALKRIEECLFRDVSLAHDMSGRGHRMNKRALYETERGLEIVSDAIIKHETTLIIGESLSDDTLKKEFPPQKKTRRKK